MATTGHARRRRHCCGMNDEEAAKADKYGRELIVKTGVSAVLYPLANIKTLFQLGYEPFPLSTGKMFGIGREAYFLPNGFSYGRNMLKKHGWSGLYNGVDAAIVATLVGGSVSFATSMYLDRYFPDIGGKPVNLEKEERELSEEESVRRLVRSAIRETAARTVGVIVARPFTVIMVRKVAQLIGGEMKYGDVISSLYVIGREEGPKGYFSGLVPQLIAEFITIWGVHSLIYVIERGMLHIQGPDHVEDAEKEELMTSTKKVLHLVAPFIVNTFSYPYTVVSTVMAVTGSG
ncbi:Mitochondrial carrier -like protein 2 [Toxocara canis]|uniref:Mitochondrial carrier-like protein 2 n=1 Tax=Toxocara canis TaxID=6265 RepID=A0A0B2VJ58_TOXCA|nr:Mitochondrial carrier -like protein 2 [Toxocara canis]